MASRPLSPHLFIYRFAYTMALSILHRGTGLLLSMGSLLLAGWLVAMALGRDAYQGFAAFAGSWPIKIMLGLCLLSFCYHFANGIRHLFWDLGWGLERRQARTTARLVVVAAAGAGVALLFVFFGRGGAP